LNACSNWGRSPFSQRLEDAASGKMMQARLPAAPPLAPPLASPPALVVVPRLHPASEVSARPAATATTTAVLFVESVISSSLS
jgi:hypothetical protein